jgi:hypothetical protein
MLAAACLTLCVCLGMAHQVIRCSLHVVGVLVDRVPNNAGAQAVIELGGAETIENLQVMASR